LSRRTRFSLLVAAAVLSGAFAVAYVFGRPAIEIEAPAPGEQVGIGGTELLVRFEPDGAVDLATVRVLLNGADVTSECTIGSNGVHAELHGFLDGDNRVRIEGRVRRPGGLRHDEAREVRVRFRSPVGFDRG
jgi:hypothetical protein